MNEIAGYIKYKYQPSLEIMQKAEEFSQKVYEKGVVYSKKRNQNNKEAIIYQSKIGKIAEIAVEKWADNKNRYFIIKGVDWNIYPANQKSFSSDIIISDYINVINISVKSSLQQYGGYTEYLDGSKISCYILEQYTYTVQLSDNNGTTGKDKGDHDIYVFCNWNKTMGEMIVHAWLKSEYITRIMINPFKATLKGIKGCIMQQTCGKNGNFPLKEFPCGLDELIERQEKKDALFS